jgi:hypothetical protein
MTGGHHGAGGRWYALGRRGHERSPDAPSKYRASTVVFMVGLMSEVPEKWIDTSPPTNRLFRLL